MPDETPSRLEDLKWAAEPARYRLLRHAAAHGSVRAKDAASIAQLDPTTGTPGYHLQKLVKCDLLMQRPDGEYVLTPTGTRIERVLSSFLEEDSAGESSATVVLLAFVDESIRGELEEVLPDASSLSALLQRRIEGRTLQQAGTVVLTRSPVVS